MESPFPNVSDECRHGRRAGGGGSDHRPAGPGQAAQPADGQTRGRMEMVNPVFLIEHPVPEVEHPVAEKL